MKSNIKDDKINEILKRAENYRKASSNTYSSVNSNNFDDLGEIFSDFFTENNLSTKEINDKNNIFLKCKISKEDALNGTIKNIEYKSINQKGEKITNKINLKIPSNIKNGQSIILRDCGNYIKEQDERSNLVINIIIK